MSPMSECGEELNRNESLEYRYSNPCTGGTGGAPNQSGKRNGDGKNLVQNGRAQVQTELIHPWPLFQTCR
jgi:hypothetical protein